MAGDFADDAIDAGLAMDEYISQHPEENDWDEGTGPTFRKTRKKMYDNTDRGALFKNKHKETDKHPDYKGTINVGGRDYDLAAWLSKSKAGQTYMSLKVSEPYDKETSGEPSHRPDDELDSEIPF